jgi:hypothetical protein
MKKTARQPFFTAKLPEGWRTGMYAMKKPAEWRAFSLRRTQRR